MRNVATAAQSIGHWVFCDVGAMLDACAIERELQKDVDAGAPLPSEGEIETLVCGESGSAEHERLCKQYPALDNYLTEQLT